MAPNCGSLQALIDAAPSGSTLSLPACVYRETVSITRPLTLDGLHRAELRGSEVWTAWNGNTSVNTYPDVGTDFTAGTAPCDQGGPCYVDYFRAFNLEQVFIDGVPQTHVPSAPSAGQFALDGSRHVLLGSNPGGRTVEVSVRKRWVNTQSDGVTLQNLGFHHAATGAFESAVSNDCHQGFVISGSVLSDAHGSMLGTGCAGVTSTRVIGNTFTSAGDVAIGGYQGSGTVIQGNSFSHNGYGGWEPNWQAGAVKIVAQVGALLDSNTVSDTFGHGLWCDIGCSNVTYSNNRVTSTNEVGIHFEISNGCRITGNAVWSTGSRFGAPSIYVSNSGDCEVDHNTVYDAAGNALYMYDANRPDTGVVQNNWFHDNTVVQTRDANYKALGFEDYGNGEAGTADEHGSANLFWYPVPEGNGFPTRYSWGQTITSSLAVYNGTPGGGGNSRYLTDTEKEQALNAAGIPH